MLRGAFAIAFVTVSITVPVKPSTALPLGAASDDAEVVAVWDAADARCDVDPPFCWVDIRLATVRSYVGGTGRRMVAIAIVGYEPQPQTNDTLLKVRFDTAGGPEADWFVKMGQAAYGTGRTGGALEACGPALTASGCRVSG